MFWNYTALIRSQNVQRQFMSIGLGGIHVKNTTWIREGEWLHFIYENVLINRMEPFLQL